MAAPANKARYVASQTLVAVNVCVNGIAAVLSKSLAEQPTIVIQQSTPVRGLRASGWSRDQ